MKAINESGATFKLPSPCQSADKFCSFKLPDSAGQQTKPTRTMSVQQDPVEFLKRRADLEDVLLEALELSWCDALSRPNAGGNS